MENIPDIGGRARWRRVFVFFGVFALIMILGMGAFFGVKYYRYRQGYLLPMERYEAYMDIFRNDTYGGATPEETLQLFVAALRAGDVEKASLYFMPDDRGSREKWLTALQSDKEKGNIEKIVSFFASAQPANSLYDGAASFKILDSDGDVITLIQMVNNGKVWKIESL